MVMSPEQWERVKELYEAALERGPSPRTDILLQSEPDALVRDEVRRLLAEHPRLNGFLSTLSDSIVMVAHDKKRFSPGKILAERFRIVEFIAAGGMGEVYRAQDTLLDRNVALKFLPEEPGVDPSSLERLRSEAKAASALNHPNICTVYDFGENEGRAFIAMEFLEGETLSARLTRGPLPVDETVKIAIPVASALASAHRKGIIHRDLKPGNIMIIDSGVKLLDFGLAKRERTISSDATTASLSITDAQIVGTLPYMSPEQLTSTQVDARADIFAFGAVLYEMLSGAKAFLRKSSSETILAVDHEEPRPLKELVAIPDDLERIVHRCLRKHREERYESMAQIVEEFEDFYARTEANAGGLTLSLLLRQVRKPRIAIPAIVALLMLSVLSIWWIRHDAKIRWARDQALPRVAQLVEAEKLGEAYTLAVQTERYIPRDPMLAKLWDKMSYTDSIQTIPSGASVYRKNYSSGGNEWEFVGVSPIQNHRFPLVDSLWKFERKGYAPVERASYSGYSPESPTVTLTEEGKAPVGMVHVTIQDPGSPEGVPVTLMGLPGFEFWPPVPVQDFWIDKYEVTNRQFKAFLDQGGYRNPAYWDQEFRKDGHVLSWSEAMGLFRDTTGRPGPATWEQGEYPRGQDEFPVAGVSWYEAAAYAKFVGRSLPTIYHWRVAASTGASSSIIPVSNFSKRGPARVGSYQGVSRFGSYDMAGNVKEWIWNQDRSGKRYVPGGAWNEPGHMFFNVDARSPFDRTPSLGFRCASYSLSGKYAKAADVIERQAPDFRNQKPVSDAVFRAYKTLYSYDKTPPNGRVESTQQTDDWTLQKITYDAAYGNERITAFLFLPRNVSPPFQTVVYFPGANALFQRSSDGQPQLDEFDFVIKSGRAVMFPFYKGTFERGDGFKPGPKNNSMWRDHVIEWSKDLGRSIDYLETRPDLDVRKLGYMGYSWGAAMGALLPAIEPRLKVLVLDCAGFYMQKPSPEVDQFNFAPRITAPVLMLNGRYDFIFPPDSSQEPLFQMFGTSNEQKRRVVYDTGHDTPRPELIRETLNWLDRYLGSVK